jgi:hypothetical protein
LKDLHTKIPKMPFDEKGIFCKITYPVTVFPFLEVGTECNDVKPNPENN